MSAPPVIGMSQIVYITAPREGVNDDVVRVVQWAVADGDQVAADQLVAVVETTKAAIDVLAPSSGYLFRLAALHSEVPVGSRLAAISPTPQAPSGNESGPAPLPDHSAVVTAKARPLMDQHGLSPADFAGLAVIRTADVERVLAARADQSQAPPGRRFGGELLDSAANWDDVLARADVQQLQSLLAALRRRMKARFDRHVPTGSLLHDRWQLARDHGFGEGTSVYDECLILGDVQVGKNCWIGPYTVLDGQGGLTIGDYVDLGAGAHIYSHNTIERALTGHQAAMHRSRTSIGNCCFIGPHAIIGPGTTIGDHSFVAAGSYVEGVHPPHSYLAGNPARRVGTVVVSNGRARLQHFAADGRQLPA